MSEFLKNRVDAHIKNKDTSWYKFSKELNIVSSTLQRLHDDPTANVRWSTVQKIAVPITESIDDFVDPNVKKFVSENKKKLESIPQKKKKVVGYFGRALAKILAEKEVTIPQLSRWTGIETATLYNLVSNNTEPFWRIVELVSVALDVSPDVFKNKDVLQPTTYNT